MLTLSTYMVHMMQYDFEDMTSFMNGLLQRALTHSKRIGDFSSGTHVCDKHTTPRYHEVVMAERLSVERMEQKVKSEEKIIDGNAEFCDYLEFGDSTPYMLHVTKDLDTYDSSLCEVGNSTTNISDFIFSSWSVTSPFIYRRLIQTMSIGTETGCSTKQGG